MDGKLRMVAEFGIASLRRKCPCFSRLSSHSRNLEAAVYIDQIEGRRSRRALIRCTLRERLQLDETSLAASRKHVNRLRAPPSDAWCGISPYPKSGCRSTIRACRSHQQKYLETSRIRSEAGPGGHWACRTYPAVNADGHGTLT